MDDISVPKYNNQYSLSIRFSSDGFSLLVSDKSNVLLSKKHISALVFSLSEPEILGLLNEEPETKVEYKNVRLICELDQYTFVPKAFFKPAEAADFLYIQHKAVKEEHVLYNDLPLWDVVNVFAVPGTLHQALQHLYPNVAIEHQVSNLLTEKISLHFDTCIHILVRPKSMDAVVFKNGSLLLANTYMYENHQDFTYYTLNLFEQLSLDTETVKVKLYNADSSPDLKPIIQRYVRFVSLG